MCYRFDQTRPDQTRPDQTRPDQTRPDHPIVRNSSLELLRIVGMLMVVATHTNHAGFNFPKDTITINRLWQQFLAMGGSLGNGVFVMLSGYFLISSSGINYRRMFNLWLRMFFYSLAIYCVFVFFGAETFSVKTMFLQARPVTKSLWWFASTYFILYLIHPYINVMMKAMNRKDCTKFIKALVIYWCIIPTLTKTSFGANHTINFVCLYCFAAYIKLWLPDFSEKKYIWLGLLCVILNFMSIVVIDIVNMKINTLNALYFIGMMRPFTILAYGCLLTGFRGLDISNSKFINLIASATFGVYLIHDNNFVRPFLWHTVFKNASFQDSPYLIPYSIACVMAVYISCTVIELMRAKVFKILSGGRFS